MWIRLVMQHVGQANDKELQCIAFLTLCEWNPPMGFPMKAIGAWALMVSFYARRVCWTNSIGAIIWDTKALMWRHPNNAHLMHLIWNISLTAVTCDALISLWDTVYRISDTRIWLFRLILGPFSVSFSELIPSKRQKTGPGWRHYIR